MNFLDCSMKGHPHRDDILSLSVEHGYFYNFFDYIFNRLIENRTTHSNSKRVRNINIIKDYYGLNDGAIPMRKSDLARKYNVQPSRIYSVINAFTYKFRLEVCIHFDELETKNQP